MSDKYFNKHYNLKLLLKNPPLDFCPCLKCKGTGYKIPLIFFKCPNCNGTGKLINDIDYDQLVEQIIDYFKTGDK